MAVSAIDEDSASVGVNSNQASNTAADAGAVYVFAQSGGVWAQQAYVKASNTGTLADGNSNAIDLTSAAPSAPAGLFIALSSTPTPFKGGTLLAAPPISLLLLATNPSGTIPLPFVMPSGVPAGTQLWLQWAIQDAAAVHGSSLSNAIRGATP